jgi:hypothetical protein
LEKGSSPSFEYPHKNPHKVTAFSRLRESESGL